MSHTGSEGYCKYECCGVSHFVAHFGEHVYVLVGLCTSVITVFVNLNTITNIPGDIPPLLKGLKKCLNLQI